MEMLKIDLTGILQISHWSKQIFEISYLWFFKGIVK